MARQPVAGLVAEDSAAALEALVVHREALGGELLDNAGGPLAKLQRTLGFNIIYHNNNGQEAVALGAVRLAVGGSYFRMTDFSSDVPTSAAYTHLQHVFDQLPRKAEYRARTRGRLGA